MVWYWTIRHRSQTIVHRYHFTARRNDNRHTRVCVQNALTNVNVLYKKVSYRKQVARQH